MLSKGECSFVIGSRAGAMLGGDEAIPAFAADADDETSLTLQRSVFSWPTLFGFNFMTGRSPTWRCHLYYRLSWKKASGARLKMVWCCEQGYDGVDGWTVAGVEGGSEVEIRPGRQGTH